METCPASGNAPSVYLIEEVTGSSPVAPIINQETTRVAPIRYKRRGLDYLPFRHYTK
jgi:hypothetical protein